MKVYDGAEMFRRCGITDVLVDERGETVARLGGFTFRQRGGKRYVDVTGPMPLAAALDLYRHPAARQDVRAGGHAAGRSPELEATWMTPDGEQVIVDPSGKKLREWEKFATDYGSDGDREAAHFAFASDPTKLGARQYVTCYHVDSELGLAVLVDKIRSLEPTETERFLLELETRAAAYQGVLEWVLEDNRLSRRDDDGEMERMIHALLGFFGTLRRGSASVLLRRHDPAVQDALREINEDLRHHKRALDRVLEQQTAYSDVDPLLTFRKLVVALAALREVR